MGCPCNKGRITSQPVKTKGNGATYKRSGTPIISASAQARKRGATKKGAKKGGVTVNAKVIRAKAK